MDDMSTPISNLHDQQPNQILDYSEILRNIGNDPNQQQQQPHQMQQMQQMQQPQQVQQPHIPDIQQQMHNQLPPQQHNSLQHLPPPALQTLRPDQHVMQPMYQIQQNQNQQKPKDNTWDLNNNKDIIIIIIICLIIYSNNFQQFSSRILPSLFRDDKLSTIGTIIFPIFVGIIYFGCKYSF